MSERDKAAKFEELAVKRVNRAIKDLELIANLSNTRNYDFTDEQAQKIIRRLQAEVDSVKKSFQDALRKNGGGFSF